MDNERSGRNRVRGRVRLDGGTGYVRHAEVHLFPTPKKGKAQNKSPS